MLLGIGIVTLLMLWMLSACDIYTVYGNNLVYQQDILRSDCVAQSYNIWRNGMQYSKRKDYYNTDQLETYKTNELVDKVYGFDTALGKYHGKFIRIYTAYPETYNLLASCVQAETWFDGAPADDTYPAAVVCGADFHDVNTGDIITFNGYRNELQPTGDGRLEEVSETLEPVSVRVAGKIGYPYLAPDFSYPFSDKSPHIHFTGRPVIYLLHDDKTVSALSSAGLSMRPENNFFYVTYHQSKTDQIPAFRDSVVLMTTYGDDPPEYQNIAPTATYLTTSGRPAHSFFVEIITNRHVLSAIFLSWVLISVIVFSIIRKKIHSIGTTTPLISTSLPAIIRYILLMSTIPVVIACLNFILAAHIRYPDVSFSDWFSSSYALSIMGLLLLVWVFLSTTTLIVPILQYKHLKKFVRLSTESYTYKPVDTYSGYEQRDFEVADNSPSDTPQ